MEGVSGAKEAPQAGEATRASRPPKQSDKDFVITKPEPDGGPSGAIINNGDRRWGAWRSGGKDTAGPGVPLGKLIIDQNARDSPAIIHRYSSEIERTIALIPEAVRHKIEAALEKKGQKFDPASIKPCAFTDMEIDELAAERDSADPSKPREMLIYVPKGFTTTELHEMWGLRSNINFDVDRNVKTAMKAEDQWLITATCSAPEMIDCLAREIVEEYGYHNNGDQVVHGMDIRRYITFLGYHKELFGEWPDRQYWVWLWATAYDRSGMMISGLDAYGALNSHGWMKNWKSKFTGSRYVILPPREEVNAATEHIERVRYDPAKNKLMKRMRAHIEQVFAERAAREAAGQQHMTPEADVSESGSEDEG